MDRDDAIRLVDRGRIIGSGAHKHLDLHMGGWWNPDYEGLPYVFIDDAINVLVHEVRPLNHNRGTEALTDKRILFELVAGLQNDNNFGYAYLLASAGVMALAHELNDMENEDGND